MKIFYIIMIFIVALETGIVVVAGCVDVTHTHKRKLCHNFAAVGIHSQAVLLVVLVLRSLCKNFPRARSSYLPRGSIHAMQAVARILRHGKSISLALSRSLSQ